MRVCLVHNDYGKRSGEEVVVDCLRRLLADRGHEVVELRRSSAEIVGKPLGAAKAFFTGIYNPDSRRRLRQISDAGRPDLLHVHNVYPLISPSVFDEANRLKIPVVMTLHNYRLLCPSGLFLSHGDICKRCLSGFREWNCIIRNCEDSLPKSAGYAARNWVARVRRVFLDKVSLFIALSEFQKRMHVENGFPADRIIVIPNMLPEPPVEPPAPVGDGLYVAYVGRVSPEKGVSVVVEAARRFERTIPFRFAGDHSRMPDLVRAAPENCEFLGPLSRDALQAFYEGARCVVVPSTCYEAFPLVTLEAMAARRAIICSRIGSLPEIVEDGVTGLLCEPGDARDLGHKVEYLWTRPEAAREMGAAGAQKLNTAFSVDRHYDALMRVYDRAVREAVAR